MAVPNFHADVWTALASGVDAAKAVYDDATVVVALSGEASSYSEATTDFGTGAGKRMGSAAITAADFGLAGSGATRKATFAGKNLGTPHVAGNPTVIAYLDAANSKIIGQHSETGSLSIAMDKPVNFPAMNVAGFGALANEP